MQGTGDGFDLCHGGGTFACGLSLAISLHLYAAAVRLMLNIRQNLSKFVTLPVLGLVRDKINSHPLRLEINLLYS